MSCLVHPLGWRLYFSKYWKANFFIPKKRYLIAFFNTKLLYDIIFGILKRYTFKAWKRDALKFSNFKLFINSDTVYILINYKFYWNNVCSSLQYCDLEKLAFKYGRKISPEQNTNVLNISLIKKYMSMYKRPRLDRKPIIFFNSNSKSNMGSFYPFVKTLTQFFYILPHLNFLKNILTLVATRIIPTVPHVKVYFTSLNENTVNIYDILDIAEYLLRIRSKPAYVFYKLIKILKHFKRCQRLKGFKVLLTGRFSRRDRATFLWKTIGQIRLSSRLSSVSFNSRSVIMHYSKCNIKIWTCQS